MMDFINTVSAHSGEADELTEHAWFEMMHGSNWFGMGVSWFIMILFWVLILSVAIGFVYWIVRMVDGRRNNITSKKEKKKTNG